MANLILLTLDAWRADFVDEYAGVRLLPALDAVADRAVRFDRAYASSPWTSPSLVSIFTGQGSLDHGVHFAWDAPAPTTPPLVSRLRAAGFHAPNLCYLNRVENYLNLGYDPAETPPAPHYTDDPLADDRLFRAIAQTPEPFFLWCHYKFTHLPYWASDASRAALGVRDVSPRLKAAVGTEFVAPRGAVQLTPADAEPVRRLYAAGVLDANAWIERTLAALADAGRADRTALVLTSDHGEELLEHGHVGHASTAEHATLFEEVLRVPLIVIDPGVTRPRRIATRVSGEDLFGTLLGLAGVPAPGVDLTPAIRGAGAPDLPDDRLFGFASAPRGYVTPRAEAGRLVRGLSDGRAKYVDGLDGRAVYDLTVDPGEREPRADDEGRWAARLAARVAPG